MTDARRDYEGFVPSKVAWQPDPGDLGPEATMGLRALLSFYEARDELLGGLFGRTRARNPLLSECLRLAVMARADRRALTVAECIARCDALGMGSRSGVRAALWFLQERGLVAIGPNNHDGRSLEVTPTAVAIGFYRRHLPPMLKEYARLVEALERAA